MSSRKRRRKRRGILATGTGILTKVLMAGIIAAVLAVMSEGWVVELQAHRATFESIVLGVAMVFVAAFVGALLIINLVLALLIDVRSRD